MKKLVWLVFMIGPFAAGQTVTVTASHLQNASGQLISGYIYLQPTLTSGQPTWYRAPGGGTVSSAAVPVPVVNGILSVTLPDTTQTYPANLCFTMTYPQGQLATGYNCLQPHTTASNASDWCQAGVCNLDNYLPGNQPLPTINAVGSINYTAGNLTFTGGGVSQSGNTFTFPAGAGLSLTTTGASGASTLASGILNIPQYAGSGANSNITSLTGLTTPLSITQGGTGQTSSLPTTPVTTAPSGSCAQGAPNQQDTVTGVQYSCQNVVGGVGTWAVGGDISGPATSIAGDLPSFGDTTGKTLTDSGVNWNGSTNALAFPGAVNITAGGTNQNITLTPSGTGVVQLAWVNGRYIGQMNIGPPASPASIYYYNFGAGQLVLSSPGDIIIGQGNNGTIYIGDGNGGYEQLYGGVLYNIQAPTATTTASFSLSLGVIQIATLTANVTTCTLSGAISGMIVTFDFLENSTGGYTVNCSNLHGLGTVVTTANEHNVQQFFYDGTNWQAIAAMYSHQ